MKPISEIIRYPKGQQSISLASTLTLSITCITPSTTLASSMLGNIIMMNIITAAIVLMTASTLTSVAATLSLSALNISTSPS